MGKTTTATTAKKPSKTTPTSRPASSAPSTFQADPNAGGPAAASGAIKPDDLNRIIAALTGAGQAYGVDWEQTPNVTVTMRGETRTPRPINLRRNQWGEVEAMPTGGPQITPGRSFSLRTAIGFVDKLARENPEQLTAIQRGLWEARYYEPEMYKNKQMPKWGTATDDNATRMAFQRVVIESLRTNRPIEDILAERKEMYRAEVQEASGMGAGLDAGLDQVITTSDPDTIRSSADQIAQSLYGRIATEDEKEFAINLVQSQQIQTGMMKGQVDRANNARSLANSGAPVGSASGAAGSGLLNPVPAGKINENFGQDRGDHKHEGVDIAAPAGTPIQAAMGGRVISVKGKGDNNAAGNRVSIQGDDGRFYSYFHMSDQDFGKVAVGQKVAAGDVIGLVGNTGRSKGNHLHFEINMNGVGQGPIDPLPELRTSSTGGTAAGDIESFMAAVRSVESTNNYDWNLKSGVGASGAYQFMPSTWKSAAKLAGIDPNDHSPAAQDAAARALMTEYAKTFNGDWRLVAIAWHAGPRAAKKEMQKPGYAAKISDKDANGKGMVTSDYAAKVIANMGKTPTVAGANSITDSQGTTTIIPNVDPGSQVEQEFRRQNPEEVFDFNAVKTYDAFRNFWKGGA